jgi:putative tricarboxylic transport membrane protein
LNLPLIGIWVKVLRIPYPLLFPLIFLLCVIAAYSLNSSVAEILLMLTFGVLGYFMRKFEYDPAVLVLSMVLSPMIENNFRQSLIIYQRGVHIFFQRPISLGLIMLALLLLLYPLIRRDKKVPLAGIGDSEGG